MNLADTLNLGCQCRTMDAARLRAALESQPALTGMTARLAVTHPHLFSSTVVFLDPDVHAQVGRAVQVLDRVMSSPTWAHHALAGAPAATRQDPGPAGVFMGYDFHLTAQGPRLIEINTNAGGAFLNAALTRAQRACCDAMGWLMDTRPRQARRRLTKPSWPCSRPNGARSAAMSRFAPC